MLDQYSGKVVAGSSDRRPLLLLLLPYYSGDTKMGEAGLPEMVIHKPAYAKMRPWPSSTHQDQKAEGDTKEKESVEKGVGAPGSKEGKKEEPTRRGMTK